MILSRRLRSWMNGIDGVVYVFGNGQYFAARFEEFLLIGDCFGA